MSEFAPVDERAFWERLALRIEADLALVADPPIRAYAAADDDDPSAFHLELAHTDYVVEIWVVGDDDKPEKSLVEALDVVLESSVFEGTVEPWPRCPHHPDDGHSLAPVVFLGTAVWQCPIDHRTVRKVGELNR